MKTVEMRQRRANLIQNARQIIDKADAEKRELTQEEKNNWDAAMTEITQLGEKIDREERTAALETTLNMAASEPSRPDGRMGGNGYEFRSRSMKGLTPADLGHLASTMAPEYRGGFKGFLQTGQVSPLLAARDAEARALQADSDVAGGYLYAPMQFVDQLIQAVDDQVFIRGWATVRAVTSAESLGAPSLENDPADPTWTSELLIGTEDSTMSFGRRELTPHPLAKYIKVSRKLLRKAPNAEGLVVGRLGYKVGIAQEKAYMTGTGGGQPLGVFIASNDGIPTSRDVSTGNTATTITFDGLKEAKYTLKGNYWPRARWIFHRDAVKMLAKIKDGESRYIWQDGVVANEPSMLMGFPVAMSEYAPNTFTANLYVGVLGDFANYWIADSLAVEFQRLVELYAATNQIGLICRLESDGMPVLSEAFVRVKLGS